MKKIFGRYRALFASILCCAGMCMAREPVLIVSSDYEPYTSSRDNGSGAVLEVVKQAFAEMHRDVVFQFYPWARCELMIKGGEAFGAAPYFKNQERLEKYDFSDPIVYSFNHFFFNKEKFPNGFSWNTLEDFRPYTIGGIIGYWYIPEFKRIGLTVDYVPNDLTNLRKLVVQRVDFFVLDEISVQKMLRENFSAEEASKIGMLEKPESFIKFHMMISRKYANHAELTAEFNQGLKIMKKKGSYLQILRRHGLPDNYAVDDANQ